jgi:hypothetical protein
MKDMGRPVALIVQMVQSSRILASEVVTEGIFRAGLTRKHLDP